MIPISIMIPAHNEAGVIARCLEGMLAGAAEGELDIIVACNGCTDKTAVIAKAAGARVVETQVASKAHALNLGDKAASGGAGPRFYVDADVRIDLAAIRATVAVLERGDILAAAPRVRFDVAGCGWWVRSFYGIWDRLPYCAEGMIGSGVYAVSAAGRKRWDAFPEITADDAFVRLQFGPGERATVEGADFTVRVPRTLWGLIKIKTRAHFGNLELRARFPELMNNETSAHRGALKRLAKQPGLWWKLGAYLLIRSIARILAQWRWRFGDHRKWERDETSRVREPGVGNA